MSADRAAAPSGVVTFLFTDVEGSTRRWKADADGMRAALAAHDEVLHGAIEAHGGFMFKHTGDGVAAAFASPRCAVDAAVAAQRALELPVRMGLATGEAELRDGDYFGAVLNRAARVMAAGHGGQILLTDSTASLLSGVDFVDLGPRRLRDLATPIGVFQVRAPGLQTDFAPVEERAPQATLQPADRFADRGLRQVKPSGRLSEVQFVRNRDEAFDLAQVHAAPLRDGGTPSRVGRQGRLPRPEAYLASLIGQLALRSSVINLTPRPLARR